MDSELHPVSRGEVDLDVKVVSLSGVNSCFCFNFVPSSLFTSWTVFGAM